MGLVPATCCTNSIQSERHDVDGACQPLAIAELQTILGNTSEQDGLHEQSVNFSRVSDEKHEISEAKENIRELGDPCVIEVRPPVRPFVRTKTDGKIPELEVRESEDDAEDDAADDDESSNVHVCASAIEATAGEQKIEASKKAKAKPKRRPSKDATSMKRPIAQDEEVQKLYEGTFSHPAFGCNKHDIVVEFKTEDSGSWGAFGKKRNIMIFVQGDHIKLTDNMTTFVGNIGATGNVKGEVVQDGEAIHGEFVLKLNRQHESSRRVKRFECVSGAF